MRFVADVMLGTLARHLRMCGHDTAYALDRDAESDEAVLAIAEAEDRRVLTRDAELAARADDAVLLESTAVDDQLAELRASGVELSLGDPERCGRCNGRLGPVGPDDATPEYAPDPGSEDVWRCVECGQHFWRGSHWADVEARLRDL